MKGLVRLLVMFAPMIIRQFQRHQRNKGPRYGNWNQPDMSGSRRQRSNNTRREPGYNSPPPPPANPTPAKPKKPQLTEEEKNAKLKEEDFMLDEKTMNDYASDTRESMVDQEVELIGENASDNERSNTTPHTKEDSEALENNIDKEELKDIFFKEDNEV